MDAETKKPQTKMDAAGTLTSGAQSWQGFKPDVRELIHDARLAHEQRDVIRQLVRGLELCEPSSPALKMAAPYLDGE